MSADCILLESEILAIHGVIRVVTRRSRTRIPEGSEVYRVVVTEFNGSTISGAGRTELEAMEMAHRLVVRVQP